MLKSLLQKINEKAKLYIDVKILKVYYLVFLFLLLVVAGYHLYFAKRLIPGVTLAGIKVGGLTYNQAVQKLSEYEKSKAQLLIFTHQDKKFELTGQSISLDYDWDATVNRAFEIGRTKNFFVDTKDKTAGIFKQLSISTYYDFDEESFNNFIATVKGEINSPAKNAEFYIKDENSMILDIMEEKIGQKVDEEDFYYTLIKALDNYDYGVFKLKIEQDDPSIYKNDLVNFQKQATDIIFSPLTIKFEELEWKLTPQQKLKYLAYNPEDKQLSFDKGSFRFFLDEISPSVNKLPRGKVLSTDQDNKVLEFVLIEDGRQIDVDQTSLNVKEALLSKAPVANVSIYAISGPIDKNKYGIYALLGEGKSKFTGSAQGRINNLTLAAERTSGILVPPGETYSFNKSVGEVSSKTGYDAAWIILGTRTVLGHGGGVCQTSTTLFRAALNSGLPIITRHPHAYRVKYYELESQVGVDASVYQPSLDFQFKNDTPNYILIQSSWNLDDQSLVFKIYGTPDGRTTEISDSVISSQTPPPAPLYQDDPTLAKGVTKQIDFPAWGASVSFTRKVKKDGEVIYDDIFKTNYQPWRAIYLVGTKE